MKPHFWRASLASRSRVWRLAVVAGHAVLSVSPMIGFGGVTVVGYAVAPRVVWQAETALESTAWGAGRALDLAEALTHLFERPASHNRIVADGAGDAVPPPAAPIIIVPQPDIRAPPLMPRRGGEPPGGPPSRKHGRGARHRDHPARTHDLPAAGSGLRPTPPGDEKGDTP